MSFGRSSDPCSPLWVFLFFFFSFCVCVCVCVALGASSWKYHLLCVGTSHRWSGARAPCGQRIPISVYLHAFLRNRECNSWVCVRVCVSLLWYFMHLQVLNLSLYTAFKISTHSCIVFHAVWVGLPIHLECLRLCTHVCVCSAAVWAACAPERMCVSQHAAWPWWPCFGWLMCLREQRGAQVGPEPQSDTLLPPCCFTYVDTARLLLPSHLTVPPVPIQPTLAGSFFWGGLIFKLLSLPWK